MDSIPSNTKGRSRMTVEAPCAFGDPFCPCQAFRPYGDACHYRDIPGSPAMALSQRQKDIRTVREYLEYQMEIADCFGTSLLVLVVQQAFARISKEAE
jgi:hypothetical protein